MKQIGSLAVLVGLGLGLGSVPAAADIPQVFCADRAEVLERLAESYGETRRGVGLGANNAVMELFASSDTGSWTITMTRPDGKTCLIASGEAFETVPFLPKVAGKGA